MKRVTSIVISVHIVFLLMLLYSPIKKVPPSKKHIAVKMVTPRVKTATPPKAVTPPATKAPAPKKAAPAPSKKNPAKKKVATEKPKPAAKPIQSTPKPLPPPPKKEEPIAKIEEEVYTPPRLELSVPKLEAVAGIVVEDKSEETLASFLHGALNLPEFGEVKIALTLKSDGSVEKVVVLFAESKKNRAYLEELLPKLRFPIKLEKGKTFTLTFCNEL
jgi:outer membrane biosynthesis protein TonB